MVKNFTKARFLSFSLWIAASALLLNLGRSIYTNYHVRANAATTYTIMRTEDGFDSHGLKHYTNHYVEAVRSDGSKVWRGTTNDVQQRKIFFSDGDFVKTNELGGLKSTYSKLYDGPGTPREPKQSCLTQEDAASGWRRSGEESVGGYRAVRVVNKFNATETMTIWYALDIGCGVLAQRLEHENGTTVQNLASVVLGEPDPALFQLSSSMKEVPPSELFSCPSSAPNCHPVSDAARERMDRKYLSHRSQSSSQ